MARKKIVNKPYDLATTDFIPDKVEGIKPVTRRIEGTQTFITEFPTIGSFVDYIEGNKQHDELYKNDNACGYCTQSDARGYEDSRWTGTDSYDDALHLLKYGWKEGAERIKHKIDVTIPNFVKQSTRVKLEPYGANACTAAYLNNNPNNMFIKKKVKKRAKVLTINKVGDLNWTYSADEYMTFATRAIAICQALERHGYAININVCFGHSYDDTQEILMVRVKNANERINLSKLAFPMAHPSMLRRMKFKYNEVTDTLKYQRPDYEYSNLYGSPVKRAVYEALLCMNKEQEIFIPSTISEDEMNTILAHQIDVYNKR